MIVRLIEPSGETWDVNSRSFRERFGVSTASRDIVDFLIRNAGCVLLRGIDASLHLKFAPTQVSIDACRAVSQIIEDELPERVSLSWYNQGWHYELLPGAGQARRRIMMLLANERRVHPTKNLSRLSGLDSLQPDNPLDALFSLWRDSGGTLDMRRRGQAVAESVKGRFLTIEREPDSNRLVFADVGPGWWHYGSQWSSTVVGKRVEFQPDLAHGKWVANQFRDAMLAGGPMLTENDVLVEHPLKSEVARFQYRRLTLPIVRRDRDLQVLSATHIDTSIDLRGEIHNEAKDVIN